MDVLIDDVAELDGPLLAALWTRAVLAGDADLVAVWEAECAARGVRAQSLVAAARRPLVAAKAKKDPDEPTHIDPGKRSGGPHDYAEIVKQSQKNIREGKSYDTGQATYKNSKGYNPYRKKKGEKGGGQFTTKEGAQTTDPNVARTELEEDDPSIPDKSPKGAEIEDFRDGMMIYKDGTRYDGEGWRDSKGRALDSDGNVIKKTGGKGGSGTSAVEREKEKAKKAAEKAKKDQERQESRDWDTAESRRKADAAAKEGNYALAAVDRRTQRDGRPQGPRLRQVPRGPRESRAEVTGRPRNWPTSRPPPPRRRPTRRSPTRPSGRRRRRPRRRNGSPRPRPSPPPSTPRSPPTTRRGRRNSARSTPRSACPRPRWPT